MNKLKQQIEQTEQKLAELKAKLVNESNKQEWIYIPELKIEVEKAIHHKGKSYNDLVKEFGEKYLEEHLLTYAQIQWLRNSKYCKSLGLIDTWEFVKQEDNISKKNKYVARFGAGSLWAGFGCNGYPQDAVASLGVRFCRKKSGGKA
jgi:hypothetical protein